MIRNAYPQAAITQVFNPFMGLGISPVCSSVHHLFTPHSLKNNASVDGRQDRQQGNRFLPGAFSDNKPDHDERRAAAQALLLADAHE